MTKRAVFSVYLGFSLSQSGPVAKVSFFKIYNKHME